EGLAMSLAPHVVLATAELDDLDLVTLAVIPHRGGHFAAFDKRPTNSQVVPFTNQQNPVEFDLATCFCREFLHAQHLALLNPILLASGMDHRVHYSLSPQGP